MLHFLHWCYTWTALLSANQNRVIFSCILLISLSSLVWGKSLTFCTCARSCARVNDAKIVRSRDAQCNTKELGWFLSIALRIPNAHDFRVISVRTRARARTKRKRFFSNYARWPNKCSFSLKRAQRPLFLFHNLNENDILNKWEKN